MENNFIFKEYSNLKNKKRIFIKTNKIVEKKNASFDSKHKYIKR